VDYVNPYMGTISHLLVPTFPTMHLPNSMLLVIPSRRDYTTDRLNGLLVVTTSHRGSSAFTISPVSGTQIDLSPVYKYSYDQETKSDRIAISQWFDGVTVITGNYFYTEWISDTDSIYARMLYDHNTDPVEMNNISENPEMHNLVDSLSTVQREHRGKFFWEKGARSRVAVNF